ncbi:MAG: 3-deoxy-D-manno-octulosonic acid transferase [Leptospira sp.]|nr:3-deoxy-D-manno-octulosonic acid transferase [Leptospira sp.]
MLNYSALALYTLFSYPIRCLFFLASFLHPRPKQFRKIRIESRKNFSKLNFSDIQKKKTYWFHGASVGELDQAKALGRVLKDQEPDSFLILSWISDSVTEKNLQDSPADLHIPLPLDGPFNYDFYLNKIRLEKLVIFAWDTWVWLILSAKRQNAQIYLACATLGENSSRKGWISRNITQICFSKMDGILPAHALHEPRIKKLISPNDKNIFIETLGDTRFDSVIQKMLNTKPSSLFLKFLEKRIKIQNTKDIFLFASTYSYCEEGIIDWVKEASQFKNRNLQFWIFPHKIELKRISSLISLFQSKGISASQFSEGITESDVIVFDEMGILAFAYQYAQIAYVGGALHKKIHNVIEPGYWSLPLITGSKIQNSSEAIVMEQLGGLRTVSSPMELSKIIDVYLEMSDEERSKLGKINKNFVMENQGASQKIYQRIWGNNN